MSGSKSLYYRSSFMFFHIYYFTPVTTNDFEYVKVEKNPKKKGYVQLHTTHGDLNIELHCDITPRTCENFITHCEKGYYNGVIFHCSIRNFMIQGGDPTGTGKLRRGINMGKTI